MWAALRNKLLKDGTETSPYKKISKKKSNPCRDDLVHECTIIIMATLFNNHPYISSSGTPIDTKLTATWLYICRDGC